LDCKHEFIRANVIAQIMSHQDGASKVLLL